MSAVTITPTSVTEYKNGNIQTVDTARLGYQSGDYSGYHDVVIELDLSEPLKNITVYQDWAARTPSNLYPTYGAKIVREIFTEYPGEADVTFSFDSGNGATIKIDKRLGKGKWFLWFGRVRNTGEAAGFVSGNRATYPKLSITGETGSSGAVQILSATGAVRYAAPQVYKSGAWLDLTPKAYKSGAWQDPT